MGKILAGFIVVAALVAGASLYYLQVYHFYFDISDKVGTIRLTPEGAAKSEAIAATEIEAIDATSSPIRFRACFHTDVPLDDLTGRYETYARAEPLNAPGWFECFDAREIGAALEAGTARAYLGSRDIVWGIDRIVAVFPDGRGYVWHQINACGEIAFDGRTLPEGCPPPPESD